MDVRRSWLRLVLGGAVVAGVTWSGGLASRGSGAVTHAASAPAMQGGRGRARGRAPGTGGRAAAVPVHGPGARRPHRLGRRRRGRSEHVLPRLGVGRRMEIHRRRRRPSCRSSTTSRCMAIGALAVAPSDPQQVWAGTGEAWVIRDCDVDAATASTSPRTPARPGRTWASSRRAASAASSCTRPIRTSSTPARSAARPARSRSAASSRRPTAARPGSACSSSNPNTGCSGLSMDANDPNTLFAGTWQVAAAHVGEFSGKWPGYTGTPGSGVYVSHDAGATWKKLDAGLPRPPVGKVDVAIAPSNSKRVYALIQTADQGSLWRSDDGGATFKVVSWDRSLIGRAGYYIRLAVNPQNAGRRAHRQQRLPSIDRRRADVPAARTAAAPAAATATTSGSIRRIRLATSLTDDGGAAIRRGRARRATCRCRTGRCTTSPPTTACRTGSTAIARTTARCADRATVSETTGNGVLPASS